MPLQMTMCSLWITPPLELTISSVAMHSGNGDRKEAEMLLPLTLQIRKMIRELQNLPHRPLQSQILNLQSRKTLYLIRCNIWRLHSLKSNIISQHKSSREGLTEETAKGSIINLTVILESSTLGGNLGCLHVLWIVSLWGQGRRRE